MTLKKLELHQETLKNLTRRPETQNLGRETAVLTVFPICDPIPTHIVSCRNC